MGTWLSRSKKEKMMHIVFHYKIDRKNKLEVLVTVV